MTPGKLELTIKIKEVPANSKTLPNGAREFLVDCDGKSVSITMPQKVYRKLEEAQSRYPEWVAAIVGKLGPLGVDSLTLVEPNMQIFERKPKVPPQVPTLPEAMAAPTT